MRNVSPNDEGTARAALAAGFAGFFLPREVWTGYADGTASTTDGQITLYHHPAEQEPFLAVIPCETHGEHRVRLAWPHELRAAQDKAAECGRRTGRPLGDLHLAKMFARIDASRRPQVRRPPNRPPTPRATVRAIAVPHPAGPAGTSPANLPILRGGEGAK